MSSRSRVVGHTGDYPTRDALADDLRKRLDVPDDGVVLVATPNGVSGSSARLGHMTKSARRFRAQAWMPPSRKVT